MKSSRALAAPRGTSVELRISLDKEPRVQIGPAKLVVTEPCPAGC